MRNMETTYNGWTNYATWRIALEIFDGLEPEPHMDAEWCQGWVETIILSDTNKGLAQDYAIAFINEVNWREIAENMQEQ